MASSNGNAHWPPLIIGCIILFLFVVVLLSLVLTGWGSDYVRQFVMDHFRVIVCLPTAGLFAFFIVAIFQIMTRAEETVRYKVFGLEFEGPGGPITMWILAFLAIAIPIGMFW